MDELDMDRAIYATLEKHFGYKSLREGQMEVIKQILHHRDVFACMATGSGKSLCYQVPGFISPGITIVVCPMISLQHDQVNSLNKNRKVATYINSELDYREICNIQVDIANGKYKFLYLSPEKLLSDDMRVFLSSVEISTVVIDEAHCISQWGHDFRTSYRNIPQVTHLMKTSNMAAFTATATQNVCNDIIKSLNMENPYIYLGVSNRPNLEYKVSQKHSNSQVQLLSILQRQLLIDSSTIIVYVCKKKTIHELALYLNSRNMKVICYHGDMDKLEKTQAYDSFMDSSANVILATVAFGMGINKENVRMVVHFDIPNSIENYLQETGRAGRDGKKSTCVLLYSKSEANKKRYCLSDQQKLKFTQVMDFCCTSQCRRASLAKYQHTSGACSDQKCTAGSLNQSCDNCSEMCLLDCSVPACSGVDNKGIINQSDIPSQIVETKPFESDPVSKKTKSPLVKALKPDPVQLFKNGLSIFDCAHRTKMSDSSITNLVFKAIVNKTITDTDLNEHISSQKQCKLNSSIQKNNSDDTFQIKQETGADWNIIKLFVKLNDAGIFGKVVD